MKRLPWIISSILLLFGTSWLGVVAYSSLVLGGLAPTDEGDAIAPPALSGLAVAGQRVYAANGCVYCHSQQVRPSYISTDIEKKLGPRRTVARDYLRDQPAFLGSQRIGPDLANYGLRVTDPQVVYRLLFEPHELNPSSLMPAYRFLFKTRPISGQRAADALQGLTGPHAPQPGYEVIPTEEARVLAAYLLSLKRDYPLPEAPPEKTP